MSTKHTTCDWLNTRVLHCRRITEQRSYHEMKAFIPPFLISNCSSPLLDLSVFLRLFHLSMIASFSPSYLVLIFEVRLRDRLTSIISNMFTSWSIKFGCSRLALSTNSMNLRSQKSDFKLFPSTSEKTWPFFLSSFSYNDKTLSIHGTGFKPDFEVQVKGNSKHLVLFSPLNLPHRCTTTCGWVEWSLSLLSLAFKPLRYINIIS